MTTADDPAEADDLAVIAGLAEQLGWSRWPDPESLIKVGDPEVQLALTTRDGVPVIEKTDRGRRMIVGRFRSAQEARQFLIMDLAESVRAQPDPPAQRSPMRRSPTSGPRPAPMPETPPPDEYADIDRTAVERIAAELGWQVMPTSPPDVLAVGTGGVGRVITFRQRTYVCESFVDERRIGKASFSSARSARRFLIMDMAAIRRTQRRLRPLRPSGPAEGFSVERGPTGYRLVGPDVDATFPIGPIGQQNALDFSRVALAGPEDIVASYADRDGAPLFS